MRRVAAEPQDQAGAGSASPLTGPLPLPGGPSQPVGVEDRVPCVAVKQVRLCVLLQYPQSLQMLSGAPLWVFAVPCCVTASVRRDYKQEVSTVFMSMQSVAHIAAPTLL